MTTYVEISSKTIENHLHDYTDGSMPISMNKATESVSVTQENLLDRPRSLLWRLFHGINYFIASLCFVGASTMFLDRLRQAGPSTAAAAGWLYTIGSFLFLLSDLVDWWYSRLGCFCYKKYEEVYEKENADLFRYEQGTILGQITRAEIGFNFFLSACGSVLYLAGSILFIPCFENYVVIGLCLVISASSVVVAAQSWKVYRAGCTSLTDRLDHRFHFVNLFNDISCLLMDIFSGLGGAFFIVGTNFFLPQYYTNSPFGNNRPAGLCLCGSVFFTLSGVVVNYRHYYLVKPRDQDSHTVQHNYYQCNFRSY
ncbi:unnamed protein product [Rotaria socialis]|uniref:YrhK domain-containing protein n=1 Tax=Rotaria socialis TaxID=392032 RepID=A0A817QFJ5_9BILA|nr:unnamed protein product [Rotaria socialis]CAF4250266.1 unnamed protein product [Rotaria socialis]